MPSNIYKKYQVKYWYSDPKINDCWGNALKKEVKARTKEEAHRKVKKLCFYSNMFRIHSIVQI